MKLKQVNNPLGAVKSPQRTSLEKANLIGLMENFTLDAIATMYKTSVQTVHTVLTNQLIERSIGCEPIDNEFSENIYYKSIGAWTNSKERISFNNDKEFIINQIAKEKENYKQLKQ